MLFKYPILYTRTKSFGLQLYILFVNFFYKKSRIDAAELRIARDKRKEKEEKEELCLRIVAFESGHFLGHLALGTCGNYICLTIRPIDNRFRIYSEASRTYCACATNI